MPKRRQRVREAFVEDRACDVSRLHGAEERGVDQAATAVDVCGPACQVGVGERLLRPIPEAGRQRAFVIRQRLRRGELPKTRGIMKFGREQPDEVLDCCFRVGGRIGQSRCLNVIEVEREPAPRGGRECRLVAGFRIAVQQPAGMCAVDVCEGRAPNDEGKYLLCEGGKRGRIFGEIRDRAALDAEMLLVAVAAIVDGAGFCESKLLGRIFSADRVQDR